MKKCINFTGRKRVPRHLVDIVISGENPRTFDARLSLAETDLPGDATVYLEAMCSGFDMVQRFRFGTVSKISPPSDRRLTLLSGENIFFRLKVVDQTQKYGRILGIAENIRPEQVGQKVPSGRRGILPVVAAPLGQEIWKLRFDETEVCLLVNEQIPGIKDRMRWDPLIISLVYPAVIREILVRAIANNADEDEESDRWEVLWLRFGKSLHPDQQSVPPGPELDDEHWEWIDTVVDAFAQRHTLRERAKENFQSTGGGEA